MTEQTSPEVASIAARGLAHPEVLTHDEIQTVCASALTQVSSDEHAVEIEKLREEVLRQRKVIEFWIAEVLRLGGTLEDDGK